MPVITNIEDLRVLAEKRVPRMFYDYADSGSWTEGTYRSNETDFQKIKLRQRVVGVTRIVIFQRLNFSGNPTQTWRIERFQSAENAGVMKAQRRKLKSQQVQISHAPAREMMVQCFKKRLHTGAVLAGGFLQVTKARLGTAGKFRRSAVDHVRQRLNLLEHFLQFIKA